MSASNGSRVSVILPVHNQADHIEEVVHAHLRALDGLPVEHELVLVANGCSDRSAEICGLLAVELPTVRTLELADGGWGRAVKAGLQAADGDLLCYTNSARTAPEILTLMLAYSLAYPDVVLKANRRARDGWQRRIGSVLYTVECRTLFNLASWDVNGTPKVFPRRFEELLRLGSDDDLIDVEFLAVCQREGYPIIEVPILVNTRHSGASTTNYISAVRMYAGALRLWSALRVQADDESRRS